MRAAFRRGNEIIADAARRAGMDDGTIDFICECADVTCLVGVPLALSEYERARGAGKSITVPGHGAHDAP